MRRVTHRDAKQGCVNAGSFGQTGSSQWHADAIGPDVQRRDAKPAAIDFGAGIETSVSAVRSSPPWPETSRRAGERRWGIDDRGDRRGEDDRDARAGSARRVGVGALPHARHRRTRDHLDPRRARSDLRRADLRRAQGRQGAAFQRYRDRHRQQLLPRRRGAGRAGLRLGDRPARAPKTLLRHARPLSRRDRGHVPLLEHLELQHLPLPHGLRDRRRIFRRQLDDPGVHPRPLPRSHRPRHQRLVLDRRRDRRGGLARVPRPGDHPGAVRLAAGVLRRRPPVDRHHLPAHLHPGKPALARHPRPRKGGRSGDGRHRVPHEGARRRPCRRKTASSR